MRYPRDDPGHATLATLDIETTSPDPAEGELVAVGVGVHDRTDPLTEATYERFHRQGDDEVALVGRATAWLDGCDADALVTYNGRAFDCDFVEARLAHHGAEPDWPAVAAPKRHLDLYLDRKERADRERRKWPSLEECLAAYDYTPAKTVWRGEAVTNTRFGEELGPAYLRTLGTETGGRLRRSLTAVIDHYLVTDLEANFALFYADVGVPFESQYLGTEARFDE